MSNQTAFEFLANPTPANQGVLCAVYGADRYLKKMVSAAICQTVAGDDDEMGAAQFDGETVEWIDVMDEISTLSLFGGDGPRVAIVDHADDFVKEHRQRLEALVANPPANALLILIVNTWNATTKLYKAINKDGLQVNCNIPTMGKSKDVDESKIAKWLVQRAKSIHQFKLTNAGARTLVRMTEADFGRMDQELAKLSLYTDDQGTIDEDEITNIVGGWPMKTMWEVIDRATEGDAGEAIKLINQLALAKHHALAMFGQIGWSLRRFAEAGELVERARRNNRPVNMKEILIQAGFRQWGGEIESATRRLRQLGRDRIFSLYRWILETDAAIKGSHSQELRAVFALEMLVIKMAKEFGPAHRSTAPQR